MIRNIYTVPGIPGILNIEVNFFASLMQYKPGGTGREFWDVMCNEGSTVVDLLNRFGVPSEDVKLIFINGLHAKDKALLKDGDRVGIFPLVGGG
ncbi:MAG: MoaD/ThiS family protein [Deltaproteobacteria bacterium]|nr:MoaD/ThiS family protein [Deltaproteobacteria bacterium]